MRAATTEANPNFLVACWTSKLLPSLKRVALILPLRLSVYMEVWSELYIKLLEGSDILLAALIMGETWSYFSTLV